MLFVARATKNWKGEGEIGILRCFENRYKRIQWHRKSNRQMFKADKIIAVSNSNVVGYVVSDFQIQE